MKSTYRFVAISFLMLVFSMPVVSAETSGVEQSQQAANPNTSGDLQLIIGMGKSNKYRTEWVLYSADKSDRIESLKECEPDQIVYIGFYISGYSLGPNQNANCIVDVIIYKPNGDILCSLPQSATVKTISRETGFLVLSPALELMLEQSDMEGNYQIQGIVTDKNTGKTAKATYEFKYINRSPSIPQ